MHARISVRGRRAAAKLLCTAQRSARLLKRLRAAAVRPPRDLRHRCEFWDGSKHPETVRGNSAKWTPYPPEMVKPWARIVKAALASQRIKPRVP